MPTWGSNKNIRHKIRTDLQQYHRKNLNNLFFLKHKEATEPLPFMLKSTWSPTEGQILDQIHQLIHQDIHFFHKRFKLATLPHNLKQSEIKALQQLRNNKQIIIKAADIGSAMVIMDRFQYLWEGHRQLADRQYYRPLKKTPFFPEQLRWSEKSWTAYIKRKKKITFKQRTYLFGQQPPRPRKFYLLSKIHKDSQTWSVPFWIPPGRPIVSDCSSETYHTAEFIDYYLNTLSTKHPSYLKDTYDFITKIRQPTIPDQFFLFTMDVNSLYTNIGISEGLTAVKNIFSQYPDPHRLDLEILQLLHINLKRNYFEFNNQFYLQTIGTAMGKKLASPYANIFMATWEEKAWNITQKKPLHYYRYLDDVWGVWTDSKADFDSWLETLN